MVDAYDDPAQMAPLAIDGSRPVYHSLIGLAHELSEASACLDHLLIPSIARSIAELVVIVVSMNCYCSNLAEGRKALPIDIEQALHDVAERAGQRNLQSLALAHLAALSAGLRTKAGVGKEGRNIQARRHLSSFAAHHRLAWIHPFPGGNGRVARIALDAMLRECGVNGGFCGGMAVTCAMSNPSINPEGLLEFIRKSAQQHKLIPGSICFELTETVAVNNWQAAAVFISECKAMGFQFALDGFGTGTSSFGYLRNLPVDYLKIDGSFVKSIEHDRVDHAMVQTMNHIGHLLGKRTVAEYAENEATTVLLGKMGVDFAQGFGVCLPKPLFPSKPDQLVS